MHSGRFSIVEYETPTPDAEGIQESDLALVEVVVPFSKDIRSVLIRQNYATTVSTATTRIPVPSLPLSCPAVCHLEFERVDFSTVPGGCCAGLELAEEEGNFICKKV